MKAPGQEEARPRLGRGLAALIGDVGEEGPALARARGQKKVPVAFLRPNPHNPRVTFDDSDLDDLADSIKEKGIIQPILTRTVPGVADMYEIIAGERRWRAAQRGGLHEVPIIVVEADDKQALELAIIENVQRADLNALEEAFGYERLTAEYGYAQADLARVIGKSRSHVANTMRLLKLPPRTKAFLGQGQLTAGHARALLAMKDPDAIVEKIVEQGLNVRDVERLAQREQDGPPVRRARGADKDADTLALEKAIGDSLGLRVEIRHAGEGGEIRILYRSLEQLDDVARRLRQS
jgi:ParB family chromosome partitioning protein